MKLYLLLFIYIFLTEASDCKSGLYHCASSNECIKQGSRCDGITHCFDGEDEENCRMCLSIFNNDLWYLYIKMVLFHKIKSIKCWNVSKLNE